MLRWLRDDNVYNLQVHLVLMGWARSKLKVFVFKNYQLLTSGVWKLVSLDFVFALMVGVRNIFLGCGVTVLGSGGSGVMTLKIGLVTFFPDLTEV